MKRFEKLTLGVLQQPGYWVFIFGWIEVPEAQYVLDTNRFNHPLGDWVGNGGHQCSEKGLGSERHFVAPCPELEDLLGLARWRRRQGMATLTHPAVAPGDPSLPSKVQNLLRE